MRRGWLLALLLLAFGAAACNTHPEPAEPPPDDVVLYESFDSAEAVELHRGVLSNPDDAGAFVPGLLGSGYWLGDGNFILYPAELLNPEQGTVEFWVLSKDNWHDGSERQILHVNGPVNFAVFKEGITNYPAFSARGHAVIRAEHNQWAGWNSWPQWPSRWTQIAVTWRNLSDEDDEDARDDGELVVYVDGTAINQYVGRVSKFDVAGSFTPGAWTSGNEANVIIDELRIYNRAKAWTEYIAYDRGLPDRELPYPLLVWPTPHPYGMRPEAGFALTRDTKVVLADEEYESLEDAMIQLRQAVRETLGFVPDLGPASRFSGADNFIAIGEATKNGLVATMADKYKLPVRPENPGPGGYVLEVYPEGIVVAGSDYAGTVHGVMTLIQILRQHAEGYIPAITLVDYPDFSIRAAEWVSTGLLLDDEAKRRIRFFASLKLSHLLIRTPDYLHLDDETVRARIDEFYAFVRRYGMEPIPTIDLMSHAEFITAMCFDYGVDCTENGDLSTYCPSEPFVYEAIVDPALRNIVDYLHPTKVHIGHDEVQTLVADGRCTSRYLSAAELFGEDVNHAYDLLRSLDPELEIWMWADMIDPLHNGGRLKQPAPYDGAPAPPPIMTLIPQTLVFNLWQYAPVDVATYILALLTLKGFEDGLVPFYTAGPVGDDVSGAIMWMRNAYDMHALGYVFRPRTNPGGPGDLTDPGWLGLPAANEFAWSLFVPQNVQDVWYDYTTTTGSYGGF